METRAAPLGRSTTGGHGSALQRVGGLSSRSPWLPTVPVVLLIASFTLFPFGYAIYKSMQKSILTLPVSEFVGWDNYIQAFQMQEARSAAINSLIFTAITVLSVTGMGLLVALLLNVRLRFFGILRAMILLPWAIPLVASGIVWKLLLHGNFGALNGLLLQAGIIDNYVAWLSTPSLAMGSVIAAHVWRSFPLPTILFLAGLQTIPNEFYEAAAVDGGGAWQRFRYITLPLIKGPLLVVIVFETMLSLATFDLVYVMTGGGPGLATTLFAWFAYIATFQFVNLGLGAALSVIMAVFLLVAIVSILKTLRVEESV